MSLTFLSKNIHSSTTSEDLSKIWVISISQAVLTRKATAPNLTRSALMSLAQRYRADIIFDVSRIHGTMSKNTIDARCQLIHD